MLIKKSLVMVTILPKKLLLSYINEPNSTIRLSMLSVAILKLFFPL